MDMYRMGIANKCGLCCSLVALQLRSAGVILAGGPTLSEVQTPEGEIACLLMASFAHQEEDTRGLNM